MQEKASRYIIYARKSSESEDRQMASIESQVTELQRLAVERDLNVVEILSESQSAKKPGRPVFEAMMEKIRRGDADGIICWKLNRLARNPVDGGKISWGLQESVIKHIGTHGRDYYPNDNVLMMAVELGMATQFVLDLSVDTKRGLKAKAERGWYPGKAPLGYRHNIYKLKGEKEILVDEERFTIVQKGFQMIVSGEATPPRAFDYVVKEYGLTNKEGKKLSESNWYAMLDNPFYTGELEYPRGSGTWYEGKHKPMISRSDFARIQGILGRKGTTRPKSHQFLYRGLLICKTCGAMITAEHKTKRPKNGKVHRYIYYHCTKRIDPNCPEKTVEEKVLKEQILSELGRVSIPESFKEWAIEHLRNQAAEELEIAEKLRKQQVKIFHQTDEKLDQLLNMRLNNELLEEEYLKKKKIILSQKEVLKQTLATPHKRHWLEEFEETLSIAKDVQNRFINGTEKEQRVILSTLGSNLYITNKKFEIEASNPILRLEKAVPEIKLISERFEPLKTPEDKEKLELSYSSSPIMLPVWDTFRTVNWTRLSLQLEDLPYLTKSESH